MLTFSSCKSRFLLHPFGINLSLMLHGSENLYILFVDIGCLFVIRDFVTRFWQVL